MWRRLKFSFFFILLAACIEPYEFAVRDETPSLVVEAYISDKSFRETLNHPSDGRYFTVKLSTTGDVINLRPKPYNQATVQLLSDEGGEWNYRQDAPGIFLLDDPDFSARRGVSYKLRISTAGEQVYESSWEAMPDAQIPTIGEVEFRETEIQTYIMEASEWTLRTVRGISVDIQVPENTSGQTLYYRHTYDPMWIYQAPLADRNSPERTCWATNPYYIKTYGLQIDQAGGYSRELFFIPTVRNERIYQKFSVLVTQHAMTEPYYYFWREMQDRNEGNALIDIPPFNLRTNITAVAGEGKVSGYFGVTSEQATRWYFEKGELSYPVDDTLLADCLVVYGPGGPAPECSDCTAYSFGQATNIAPVWWKH